MRVASESLQLLRINETRPAKAGLVFLSSEAGRQALSVLVIDHARFGLEEPVSVVRVVFAPVSTADNHSPGPWAKGVTDESGRYVLWTRDGSRGAVVGTNNVGFEWDDISFDAMSELREQIELGTNVASAKARLKEIKQKLASRIDLRTVKSPVFVVPAAGTSNADFELGE